MPTSYWSEKKYGSAVVGRRWPSIALRGDRPLMQRVGPVLDADPLAVEGVVGVGDVAGGEHAGRAGPQVLVDEDAVVDREAGLGGELGARLHADTDDHEVALEHAAVAGADALDRVVALEGLDALCPRSIRTPWSAWMSR